MAYVKDSINVRHVEVQHHNDGLFIIVFVLADLLIGLLLIGLTTLTAGWKKAGRGIWRK